MRLNVLFLFILSVCATSGLAQAPIKQIVIIDGAAVIRDAANPKGHVVMRPKVGMTFKITVAKNSWYYVDQTDVTGWVRFAEAKPYTKALAASLKKQGIDVFDEEAAAENAAPPLVTTDNKWVLATSSADNFFYLNGARVVRRANLVQFLVRTTDIKDGAILSLISYETDCNARKIRTLTTNQYYSFQKGPGGRKDKTKIDSTPVETPNSKFSIIVRGSINEYLAQQACKMR